MSKLHSHTCSSTRVRAVVAPGSWAALGCALTLVISGCTTPTTHHTQPTTSFTPKGPAPTLDADGPNSTETDSRPADATNEEGHEATPTPAAPLDMPAASSTRSNPELPSPGEQVILAQDPNHVSAAEHRAATDILRSPVPAGTPQELLATLVIQPPYPRSVRRSYKRAQFGPAWTDVDRNGCDTRNDILARDLTELTFKPRTHDCVVLTGHLQDPYTGQPIDFQRGRDTSAAVQIDHIVALSNAWRTGAAKLPYPMRLSLANDPLNLVAVDGPANQQKSDSDAAQWLPTQEFQCDYVTRQVQVKAKYNLFVTPAEHSRLAQLLDQCSSR